MSDVAALRRSLDGQVLTPDSPGYDDVRRPADVAFWNLRPQMVIVCRSGRVYSNFPDPALDTWLASHQHGRKMTCHK